MTGFDWPGLMRAGLRELGLTPDVFWSLTPAELRLMLGDASGLPPMDRGRLKTLLKAFPDENEGNWR